MHANAAQNWAASLVLRYAEGAGYMSEQHNHSFHRTVYGGR
jgi:hypothetical protein